MPEIDNTIALKTQVPNAMERIGSMLNIAGQAQQLQGGAQQIQRGGIALQQEQADIGERNALRQLAGRLNEFKTAGGEPDYPKLIDEATKVAPKTGMEWVQKIAGAHVQSLTAQKAIQELDATKREAVARVTMSVAGEPLDVQRKAFGALVAGTPSLKPYADITLGRLAAAGSDEERKKTAIKIGQHVLSTGEQNQALSGRVSTGGELKPSGPMAEAGGTSTLPVTLGPGSLEQLQPDAAGNLGVVTRSPQGVITSTRPVPGAQGQGGAGAPPSMNWNLPPGSREEIPERTKQRVAVNQAASQVPEQHFNNQQIINLAPVSLVGTGSQAWSKVFSANGLQWIPGEEASNLQRLGHFMARQTEANSKAMGAGTDAARDMSEKATGTTAWTPQAIVSTAKVNDAFATGMDYFNRGMEKAIAAKNGSVLAVRDFQNAWSQNFDPRAMQLHNAIQAGDKKEVAEVVKAAGGAGSPGAKALARKTRNLEKLANDGKL